MALAVEALIPWHGTSIFMFALVNLLLHLYVSSVDADIIVKDLQSNETAARYPDLQAKFGPDFPEKGFLGQLIYAEPPDACEPVQPPPLSDRKYAWILLIARGGKGNCQFVDKVLNAQLHNYSAVIVHNYENKDSRIPMGGDGSRITIPSTFVGWTAGINLKHSYNYKHREFIIKILKEESGNLGGYLWPFLLVLAVCILMVMIVLLLKFLRDQAKKRFSRLSSKHLKKIPVRKYKKGDHYDMCAICLDEFEEGEKIRVLLCDHVYHRKCIDPWLTKSKTTCPVCKRRVIPKHDAESESSSEADEGEAATRNSENTPLLTGRPNLPSGHQSHGSISGSTVVVPLEHGRPADLDVENGAAGGLGISDRTHFLPAENVSSRDGSVLDHEKKGIRSDRKRRRQERNQREDVRHREEEAAGSSQVSEPRGHRERRKKKKEKKKSENAVVSQEGDDDDDERRGRVSVGTEGKDKQELNEVV